MVKNNKKTNEIKKSILFYIFIIYNKIEKLNKEDKKKIFDFIDNTFSKIKKNEKIKKEEKKEKKEIKKIEKIEKNEKECINFLYVVKPVKYDKDGLPIYTEEQLKLGTGGNTPLCPFDCDCCF